MDILPSDDSNPALAPIASLFGEPVTELPKDLYIPPDALRVFLEAFEGPLDLLLYLIRKQNINVIDIPMARITAQYMEYIELMQQNRLELAAEYLLMAAVLIEIKSRMLLPRPAEVEGDEGLDPRAELVRRLLEYEQMKLAAYNLDQLPQAERDFAWAQAMIDRVAVQRLPEVDIDDLRSAWMAIIARTKANTSHKVTREELSVREHMTRILRLLADGRFLAFHELFVQQASRPVLVVNFIAVLELVKESLVFVTQAQPYAPIYVRLSVAADQSTTAMEPA
ncbi:segregation and condensation protein A [Chitinivorax tropicus]|uniref:Segregation and condensation protein A n=1 Tax=Chitinivorax tropicus TaxID=714531 RepID=A0A840ME42_9PROT|nr:ScpA family protein [Chitinivorax tropicus]MBB5016948.1 segregation and condensation protein A [Chitinivorax tropicus]